MPVINQWRFTDLVPVARSDENPIIYNRAASPNAINGDAVPYMVTPYGGAKASFITQASPYFITGLSGGEIRIGFYFNGGTSGSVFDIRCLIQGTTGGFFALRVYCNPNGTIDLGLGGTAPGAYGLTKTAKNFYRQLSAARALEDIESLDPVYVSLIWSMSPPDSARPVVQLFGGAGVSQTAIPVSLSENFDYADFPAAVTGGTVPPFDPTTAQICSISPVGLYTLNSPTLEQTIFYGPESVLVFSYFVTAQARVIVDENWNIPIEYTSANVIHYEDWPAIYPPLGHEYRAATNYHQW